MIAAGAGAITAQFAADRRRRPVNRDGDRAYRLADMMTIGDLDPFGLR
jgi:hypothetical protein